MSHKRDTALQELLGSPISQGQKPLEETGRGQEGRWVVVGGT